MRTARNLTSILVLLALAACGGGGGDEAPTEDLLFLEVIDWESDSVASYGQTLAGHVPGLVTFNLEFLNGDHHVAAIVAGDVFVPGTPDPNTFSLQLRDGDYGPLGTEPDDPVRMYARYYDLQAVGPRHVVTGFDLQGVARLPLSPDLAPGERFVLSGFGFRTDGENHHLRILRVEPFPELGYVEVEYRDDSPGDDLYEATVAYVIVPASRGPGSALRPRFSGPFEENFSFSDRTTTVARVPGLPVIRGFSLAYRDGDRHVERVEIDMGWPTIFASLRDGNPTPKDDTVDARVSYHIMEP
ncbi:MAG: hypothetical protein QNJ90_09595 [Planctomycetota bacterium]|nr:hypothetical protein [Planctomycetota bacterium]